MKERMRPVIQKGIINCLHKAQRFINRGDSKKLKYLSDYAISNTGIYQDADSLTVAVVLYAISKLLERYGFDNEYAEEIRNLLGGAAFSLEQSNLEDYREQLKNIRDLISNIEKSYRIYVEKVIEKAQIKKGSRIYEQGISAARAAELLGIGQWELMSYIGKTRIHDEVEQHKEVHSRLEFARSLFR